MCWLNWDLYFHYNMQESYFVLLSTLTVCKVEIKGLLGLLLISGSNSNWNEINLDGKKIDLFVGLLMGGGRGEMQPHCIFLLLI